MGVSTTYRAALRTVARLAGSRVGAAVANTVGLQPRSIWCLHRFVRPGDAWTGDSVETVGHIIRVLSARGVRFVALDDLLSGAPLGGPAVAVTVDDGYADFATHAWPMFKALRCPVSLFLTTGPVVERQWFWGDYLDHALSRLPRPHVDIELVGMRVELTDPERRRRMGRQLRGALKLVPDDERRAVLADLARQAGVDATEAPSAPYRALEPVQVEQLAAEGVQFGAHTVTHPILSRCSAAVARWEITESVRIVGAMTGRPVTTFAYPNGMLHDYGAREVAVLGAIGVPVAVTTSRGRVVDTADRLRLPRLVFRADLGVMSRRVMGYPLSL
ncbi:polysaccharide deacetylase family protein [Gemmatimonas sp.]|jgi:peptidoglycan/xylan/chitin deacetylase (PgdA/CDA1 family)|uniref:polysaccharide deacetylase family protein n=2 Tax=Gemmatimonas sp. TaxID=1962908 RepID=UPI00391B2BF1